MLCTKLRPFIFGLSSLLLLPSCGQEPKKKAPNAPPLGEVAQVFHDVASRYRLPKDILMAVAYKESGFAAEPSRGIYDQDGSIRGMQNGETTIGLPRSILKLDDTPENHSFRAQMEAYGAFVRASLDAQHLDLSPALNTADAVYDWAWQLAQMHSQGKEARKNVQILFAMETIETLNRGFLWQDDDTLEKIELPPRNPPLTIESFSAPIQANLQLDTSISEIFTVDYLQLTYGETGKIDNQPKRVIVVHCPLTLSSCLASQVQPASPNHVMLGAHYIIPADDKLLKKPVKILPHRAPVRLTDTNGQQQLITDAIVVMIVGQSGHYQDGQRLQVDPSWYSRKQLQQMGKVIEGVCTLINRDDPSVDMQRCRTPQDGLEFRVPSGKAFRIGDIPDFEPSIFWSFARSPDDLSGDIDLQLPVNQKLFPAGSSITLNLAFIRSTAKIDVQILERCPSGKTVWSTINSMAVRNIDRKTIQVERFDQGPNLNGQQFVRALAYDANGRLMGWGMQDFFLSNFDRAGTPGPNEGLCAVP
jgi:hypothetical protein